MTQPEALRLADRLRDGWGLELRREAEAELRRLHELAMDQQGKIYALEMARSMEQKTAKLRRDALLALAEPPTNQCGETCERAKLCAVCARELAEPLTEETMRKCAQAMDAEPLAEGWHELIKFARAIERAHGIGGQDEP